MPLVRRAPAKINLYLRVFPAAADGFHPLRSWFRTIDLADCLRVEEVSDHPVGDDLHLECSDPWVPTDSRNLIVGARRLADLASPKQRNPAARVTLEKNIPVGAGLGGGSSDGAAMLALDNQIRRTLGYEPFPDELLLKLAKVLGADVPFFLHHQLDGTTDATCTGRGGIVQPFAPARRHAVLLILPELAVSTAAVYTRFDGLPAPAGDDSPDFAAWSHLPATELLPQLRNDLEAAAFSLHPELARLREHMESRLGRPVRMTGSGSGLFTLYDDGVEAAAALKSLEPALDAALRIRLLLA